MWLWIREQWGVNRSSTGGCVTLSNLHVVFYLFMGWKRSCVISEISREKSTFLFHMKITWEERFILLNPDGRKPALHVTRAPSSRSECTFRALTSLPGFPAARRRRGNENVGFLCFITLNIHCLSCQIMTHQELRALSHSSNGFLKYFVKLWSCRKKNQGEK